MVTYMNEHYDRTGNNTWCDKIKYHIDGSYEDIAWLFSGRAYVVGKGKSADGLTASHFDPKVPIFCTNEAVLLVEKLGLTNPIIGVRQDGKHRYYTPASAYMLIKQDIIAYYSSYEKAIPWNYIQLGITSPCCTCAVILRLCKQYSVCDIQLYGFDAHTSGELVYSDCADDADKAEVNDQLLKQRHALRDYSKGLDCKWFNPDLENYLTEL